MKELIVLQTHVDFSQKTESFEITTPTVMIYGNTLDGSPIQIHVKGFLPYFYIQSKFTGIIKEEDLQEAIQNSFTKGKCLLVECVERQNIYGFSDKKSFFYKVSFNSPFCFKAAKALFEEGVLIGKTRVIFKVFESNFPFVLRFMNDMKMTGMSYIKVENYRILSMDPLVINTNTISALPLEGDYIKILPLKMLSFDIECTGPNKGFPSAQVDPIIQIGNTVQRYGSEKTELDIFCLKETAPIPGANVHWFDTETDLLLAWRDYLLKEDPDILIGYNIKNFDFPYIFDRAEVLKLDGYAVLGRTSTVCKIVNKQQSSTAFGSFDAKDISIDGRLIFDLLHIIRRDYKLKSYSLNAVSFHFLQEQKEDVPHTSMHALQNESKETRRRIASYCLRDTYLPLRIFDKLNLLVNYAELARATYVPIEYFSTRGSAIKVLSQIYRAAGIHGYLVPDMNVGGESTFEGAFVMDPIKGFYSDPIAVLDFSSLYPSIMISKNLCYTTLLTKEQYQEHGGIVTPTNNYFCTASKKEGLLPMILRNLLSTRKETKRLLKETKDPAMRKSLDGRQNALKVCANSIYGFTGANIGQLPCIEIPQSVTAFGRDMISLTKQLIENTFTTANGYSHTATVIYGDTDSVMINFKEGDIARVFSMAKEIASFISNKFEKPVSLEFEKVYHPYLLMNKKRYAGLIFTNPDTPDRIDTKGIETVRRDNCELVRNVIQTCLDYILFDRNITKAIEYVKGMVRDLYMERIDLSQLVISKTYTKTNYANKQPHAELAEKLMKRGIDVGIGDRIEYVIIEGNKKSLACEKSEDPVYVLEHNLPIDKKYYIEQQLSKPIHRLFEPIMDNVSALFNGEHTKVITRNVSVSGPMNAFVKAQEECIGCKKTGKILCANCNFSEQYLSIQAKFDEKTKLYNECWAECQRCQGSLINEVLCVNRICPIWYMRTKVKKEIGPLQSKIDKLRNVSW